LWGLGFPCDASAGTDRSGDRDAGPVLGDGAQRWADERHRRPGDGPLRADGRTGSGRRDPLSEWGEDGQDTARESLWIDFCFLLAYGAFLTLALAAVRDLARASGWRRLAAIGVVVVSFGRRRAAFDALEDVCLLLTLEGAGAAFSLLATIFAAGKFLLVAAAIAYLVAGLTWVLKRRPAART
jgi:hypothetical protein